LHRTIAHNDFHSIVSQIKADPVPLQFLRPIFVNYLVFILGQVARRSIDPSDAMGPLLYGFLLLLVLFLLINLDRRFREYVTRALMRPFNFFADIRDQRLIPNAQTTLLALVISGALGLAAPAFIRLLVEVNEANNLIHAIIPNSWRGGIIKMGGYMGIAAWATIAIFIVVVFMAAVMRFCAIFIRGRILIGDTFNVTVWALLPIVLLLPLDLILPRMDIDYSTLLLTLSVFIILFLWIYFRILKGAGVLFDIYPTQLYIYGMLVLAVASITIFIYLQYLHI
jgi:hypothetical protein